VLLEEADAMDVLADKHELVATVAGVPGSWQPQQRCHVIKDCLASITVSLAQCH
jgi:hypothetical protein